MPVQEFEFCTDTGQFVPALQQMLQYVGQQPVSPAAVKEQLLFEAKVILTELLTNAIKHSGTDYALLRIEVGNNYIKFSKTDNGVPMALLQHPHLNELGTSLTLISDWMHTLQVKRISSYLLHFTCTECEPAITPDVNELQEHFGLLMMAKIAHECSYRYHEHTGENVFTLIRQW